MPHINKFFWFILCSLCVLSLLIACSSDPKKTNFAYLRSPGAFRADTTLSDHPFCTDATNFASKEDCVNTKKYRLTWNRPEDTVRLLGYRIYLDTTDPQAPAGKNWDYVKSQPELASLIVPHHSQRDSVVFVFGNKGFVQDTLKKGIGKIFILDSTNRESQLTGNLDFALVPIYGGGVTPGQPQIAFFKTRDKESPSFFIPVFKPLAKQVEVRWERPTDRISFFNPNLDSGLIREYRLEVKLEGRAIGQRSKTFNPKIDLYDVGSQSQVTGVTDSLVSAIEKYFRLPDSNRSSKGKAVSQKDSLRVIVGNLLPQDTISFRLYATDSSGNGNKDRMPTITLLTTDTTQPSTPKLKVDSISRNGFIISWSASRDSIQENGNLVAAKNPNFNIQNYRLSRVMQRAIGAKSAGLARFDTTLDVEPDKDSLKEKFSVAVKFLPPGTEFKLSLTAIDRTGFLSATDTLTITTKPVLFSGVDSALVCPPGFIPIPRGKFELGDDTASSGADEKPLKIVTLDSYCIEPYEHRDTTGKRFVSNVSYAQAVATCKDMAPNFASQLCSEVQWERACEGPDSIALVHGILSEGKNPAILQSTCNQGANDLAMAMSFELRNATCLTSEGVYDMAGNLSEWVLDPYSPLAYRNTTFPNVVPHGFALSDPDSTGRRGFRGGNFLKTNFPQQAATQSLARCSNRDFAKQVRPVFRSECKSEDSIKIAVMYGSGLHQCIPIEDSTLNKGVTEILPAPRDSSKLLVFIKGKVVPDTVKLPVDTAFSKRKPISAKLTTLSLAEVIFQNVKDPLITIPDTLDATEMRDTSQAGLAKIFTREASNSEWTVKKENGKFLIKYLYAYSTLGTKPAQVFYSSRAIGFRCCSLAKTAAPPIAVPEVTPVPVDTTNGSPVVANP